MKKSLTQSDMLNIPELKRKILNRIDPCTLLQQFGVNVSYCTDKQVRCACPIHNGDNQTAFVVTISEGGENDFRWICNTKCNTHGDIIDFIMAIFDIDFREAVSWLCSYSGVGSGDCCIETAEQYKINTDMSYIRKFNKEIESVSNVSVNRKQASPFINESFVEECIRRRNNYFKNRGIEDYILDKFEVGFCPEYCAPPTWKFTPHPARVTIPIRKKDGTLAGISGRVIVKGDIPDKYVILPGTQKRSVLYGLNHALPYIRETNSLLLVEGFAHVWRCWQNGKRNVVAVMGKTITDEQFSLIIQLANRVGVATDGDEPGIKGGNSIQNKLLDYVTVYRVNVPKEVDLGDVDAVTMKKILKNNYKVLEKVNTV